MSKESKNIESWGNQAMGRTRDEIASSEVSANERNRAWWEALPMTYEDWEGSDRDPVDKEDFARVDRHYFGTNPYLDENIDFSSFNGQKVMEIGCGAGSASCRFAESGADVTAIDITAKAIELTTRHAEVFGIQRVNAVQSDAEDLSVVPDGSIDYIYSWGVMHHSSRPEVCFKNCFSKLKTGSSGLIMVYNKSSLRYWGKGLGYLLLKGKIFKGDNFHSVQRHFTDGYYHKHYTRASLREAMENAGFTVEGIDITHMSSRMIPFIPGILRKWLKTKIGWLIVARVAKKQSF